PSHGRIGVGGALPRGTELKVDGQGNQAAPDHSERRVAGERLVAVGSAVRLPRGDAHTHGQVGEPERAAGAPGAPFAEVAIGLGVVCADGHSGSAFRIVPQRTAEVLRHGWSGRHDGQTQHDRCPLHVIPPHVWGAAPAGPAPRSRGPSGATRPPSDSPTRMSRTELPLTRFARTPKISAPSRGKSAVLAMTRSRASTPSSNTLFPGPDGSKRPPLNPISNLPLAIR